MLQNYKRCWKNWNVNSVVTTQYQMCWTSLSGVTLYVKIKQQTHFSMCLIASQLIWKKNYDINDSHSESMIKHKYSIWQFFVLLTAKLFLRMVSKFQHVCTQQQLQAVVEWITNNNLFHSELIKSHFKQHTDQVDCLGYYRSLKMP